MKRPWVAAALLVGSVGCADLREASPDPAPASEVDGGADVEVDGGSPPATSPAEQKPVVLEPSGKLSVQVTKIVTGRSRPGARSEAGFRAYRGGVVALDDRVVWVESGATPGLYAAPYDGCSGAACAKLATFTRPAVVSATATDLFVADVKTAKRFALADLAAAPATVASSADEILGLAPFAGALFWTTERGAINRTVFGGTTSTPINSNGTPVAMAQNGTHAYWMGADISGVQGLLQRIAADGTKARGISSQTGPFGAMGGAPAGQLYFARGNPAELRRIGANDQEEVVADGLMPVTDFAFDAEYAYWTEAGSPPDYLAGRVKRVRHDAKTVELLADAIPRPVAVAVRGREVFVLSAGTAAASYADGAVLRCTLTPTP